MRQNVTRSWVAGATVRGIAIGLVAGLVGAVVLSGGKIDESRAQQQERVGPAASGLWRDVPSTAFAILAEGKIHGTQWGVYVFRPPNGGAPGMPCLMVASRSRPVGSVDTTACGKPAPVRSIHETPVFPARGESRRAGPGAAVIGEWFGAMSLSASVMKIQVDFGPGGTITRRTSYLSANQGRKARVERFRYVTFAMGRDVCVNEIRGYDNAGDIVLESSPRECERTKDA